MRVDLSKLDNAIADTLSLRTEVANGFFIPKRFRKASFDELTRTKYVAYLDGEIKRLREKLAAMSSDRKSVVDAL